MKTTTKRNLRALIAATAMLATEFASAADKAIPGSSYETYTARPWTSSSEARYEAMDALQLTRIMGNGINLGNTMEATGSWMGYNQSDASDYETAWGQPKTTKAMFQAMKKAGFDSVRIPVAWTNTMDWSNGDFQINKNYLERVAQVVTWALESDLFVMINDHWDYQWWGLFSHDEALAFQVYEAIWTQVGSYFKDYSYKLIFEGGNEELGHRFNDTVDANIDSRLKTVTYSTPGTLSESECYMLLTKVTQKFVDIIRAQGGNNTRRFLLIPGYDTDIEKTCDTRYAMPNDPQNAVQKLLISVHYYSPALYCLVSNPRNSWGYKTSWGTASDVSEQNALFRKMKKFTDAGYGVIIGEYAVCLKMTKGYNTKKSSDDVYARKAGDTKWLTNVLDNCDTYNYCPFLWDCNTYFSKSGTLGFTGDFADIAGVYKNRSYASEAE
ncbi:MAG TPA: hypothetical protein DDW78_00730 [Treponema sp.]|nr:hypothetical protein [Treponema sp.]